MAQYVDGFVLPVQTKNIATYKKMAELGRKIWLKHGALDYKECIGEDLKGSKWSMPFTKMVTLKKGETIVFAYIVFKSRKHRDQVNAKVMKDPEMSGDNYKDVPMPFDMKKMAYGGFEVLVG